MNVRTVASLVALSMLAACSSAPERELSSEVSRYAALPNGHDPVNPSEFKAVLVPSNDGAVL